MEKVNAVPAKAEAAKTAEEGKVTAEAKAAEKKAAAEAKAAEKLAKKEAAAKAKAEEKANKPPGIIASILVAITEAKKPITQAEILAQLEERFPDKPVDGMAKTVKAQTGGKTQPTRMESEKGVTFVITVNEETKVKSFMLKK